MEYTLFTKLAAEFVGTAVLMVFGNGAVANAELKNTKGYHAGWLNIAMGYGFGVMFPVLMFGGVSGAHINPAMTLAQAVNGMFPWNEVLPYIIAQLLGAVAGQLIVYVTYLPHYKDTDDAEAILGTFCTTDAHNDRVNYFLNEFFGTFMLVLGALCCLSLPWGKANPAAASIVVGFIVWGLVTSMGGPTGPGLNPARDLMPRLLHAILPIPNKGDSRWGKKMYSNHGAASQTMANSGCGPTSMADIVATLKDASVNPYTLAQLSMKWGTRTYSDGTAWGFFAKVQAHYGFSRMIQTTSLATLKACLDAGGYVVCSMGPGYWTKGGHFICAWKYDDAYIYCNDPASSTRKRQSQTDFVRQRKQFFCFYA